MISVYGSQLRLNGDIIYNIKPLPSILVILRRLELRRICRTQRKWTPGDD
jgi:hypothetical protein